MGWSLRKFLVSQFYQDLFFLFSWEPAVARIEGIREEGGKEL